MNRMKKFTLSLSLFLMMVAPSAVFAAEEGKEAVSYNPPSWVAFLMIGLGIISCLILMASMRKKVEGGGHH